MLSLMAGLLGAPSERIWPGLAGMPHRDRFSFPQQPYNYLRKVCVCRCVCACVCVVGVDVLCFGMGVEAARFLSAAAAQPPAMCVCASAHACVDPSNPNTSPPLLRRSCRTCRTPASTCSTACSRTTQKSASRLAPRCATLTFLVGGWTGRGWLRQGGEAAALAGRRAGPLDLQLAWPMAWLSCQLCRLIPRPVSSTAAPGRAPAAAPRGIHAHLSISPRRRGRRARRAAPPAAGDGGGAWPRSQAEVGGGGGEAGYGLRGICSSAQVGC